MTGGCIHEGVLRAGDKIEVQPGITTKAGGGKGVGDNEEHMF